MGDLNKGETFAAGETVSAARLHRLVEDATLKAGVVTTTKIADGAITTEKLASSVSLTVSSVAISENKVLVGNASGIGAEVAVDTGTMNPAGFGVKALGIAAAQLAVDAVETAKIKDANVTLPKLAAQAASTIVANGTGGSASPTACALGTGLEFSGGALRVSASVTAATVAKYTGTATVPASGAIASASHSLGAVPSIVQVYLECLVDTMGYRANTGSGNPDRVPIDSLFSSAFVPAFTLNVNDTTVEVIRYGATSDVFVFKRTSGGVGIGQYDYIHSNIETNWRLRIIAWA